jgi:hypothetical protein
VKLGLHRSQPPKPICVDDELLSQDEGWPRLHASSPGERCASPDEGRPDLVVAFPGGGGTKDIVRRAVKAGVSVHEVNRADEWCVQASRPGRREAASRHNVVPLSQNRRLREDTADVCFASRTASPCLGKQRLGTTVRQPRWILTQTVLIGEKGKAVGLDR